MELRGALPFVYLDPQSRRLACVNADCAQTGEQFFGSFLHLVQCYKPDMLFVQSALLICHRHLAPTRAIISLLKWNGISQSYCEAHVVSTGSRASIRADENDDRRSACWTMSQEEFYAKAF